LKSFIKKLLVRIGVNPKQLWRPGAQKYEEIELVSALFENSPESIMIDVGSAWGNASLPFLMKGWRVYAFEPDRSVSKVTEMRLLQELFPNSFVFSSEAVSESAGEERIFYTSSVSAGISSLHSFQDHAPSHVVTTTTLDEVVLRHQLKTIGFLKIDVEGHDLFVLDSLSFEECRPSVVMVEFDDAKTNALGYDCQTLIERLKIGGYAVYVFEWCPIERYGGQHNFRRITKANESSIDEGAWGNLIAVDSDLEEKFEDTILKSRFSQFFKQSSQVS
jgi:FkbM family methyltransferase